MKAKRQFHQLSRSWYGKDTLKDRKYTDKIMFGMYIDNDGCEGEMAMGWYNIGKGTIPTAKLEVFEDSFNELNKFIDVIKELAKCDNEGIQPDEFCEILKSCGFEDRTQEKIGDIND